MLHVACRRLLVVPTTSNMLVVLVLVRVVAAHCRKLLRLSWRWHVEMMVEMIAKVAPLVLAVLVHHTAGVSKAEAVLVLVLVLTTEAVSVQSR